MESSHEPHAIDKMESNQEKEFFENCGNVLDSMRLLAQITEQSDSAMRPAVYTLHTVATRVVSNLQDADEKIKEYRASLEKTVRENEASNTALQAERATLASASEGFKIATEQLLEQNTELEALKQSAHAEKKRLEAAQRTLSTQQQEVNTQSTIDATTRVLDEWNRSLRERDMRLVHEQMNLDLKKAELKQETARASILITQVRKLVECTQDIKAASKKHQEAIRENDGDDNENEHDNGEGPSSRAGQASPFGAKRDQDRPSGSAASQPAPPAYGDGDIAPVPPRRKRKGHRHGRRAERCEADTPIIAPPSRSNKRAHYSSEEYPEQEAPGDSSRQQYK